MQRGKVDLGLIYCWPHRIHCTVEWNVYFLCKITVWKHVDVKCLLILSFQVESDRCHSGASSAARPSGTWPHRPRWGPTHDHVVGWARLHATSPPTCTAGFFPRGRAGSTKPQIRSYFYWTYRGEPTKKLVSWSMLMVVRWMEFWTGPNHKNPNYKLKWEFSFASNCRQHLSSMPEYATIHSEA